MTEYIFRKSDKEIKFIGNFEGLYQNEDDPWGQSGKLVSEQDKKMMKFYSVSREILLNQLSKIINENSAIVECGCGTGYVVDLMRKKFPKIDISGFDIAPSAIEKAKANFKNETFFVHNILQSALPQKVNILILSNVLWYVVHDISNLVKHCLESLEDSKQSYLIIQNALFKTDQSYANELINSAGSCLDVFKNCIDKLSTDKTVNLECQFVSKEDMEHDFIFLSISTK